MPKGKCSGGDLNPHALRHTPLKRTCLPFHHPSRVSGISTRRRILSMASSSRKHSLHARQPLAASIGDPPQRAIAVFGHEQCAVVRDRDTHGAAPDTLVIHDKAGEKIIVLAGGEAVIETDAD